MLIVRQAQMKALEQASLDAWLIQLAQHCRDFSPYLSKTLRDAELHAALLEGVQDAEREGFTQRGPVRLYIDTMMILGTGFASDPQYPWISQLLSAQRDESEMDRAMVLHSKLAEYLTFVDGESNVHTLRALGQLDGLLREGVSFPFEGLEGEILRLMWRMHPRKAARSGEAALAQLISEATSRGRRQYGFQQPRSLALMAVLAFSFGWKFDTDPFLPWISRSLARGAVADPEAVAHVLERRSTTWLSAVLRNAEGRA
jgi:hypothetical protein